MTMQKTPDDFDIYYVPEDIYITNIWEFGYTDVIDGFGMTNRVESKMIIKIIFVDKDGKLRCIEDSNNNFVFTPKEVDKEDKE
jgi:hypothetical protein